MILPLLNYESESETKSLGFCFIRKCDLLLCLVRAQHDHYESKCERKSGGISEDAMGGWKKEGGGKPHEWRPSQNGVLDPPSYGTFSTPPSGVSALFFLYKNPRQSRPEALLEGSKNFRESAFSGTFSPPPPPYVLHPPISPPKNLFAFPLRKRKQNKISRFSLVPSFSKSLDA